MLAVAVVQVMFLALVVLVVLVAAETAHNIQLVVQLLEL
jgi:hypothetical protein